MFILNYLWRPARAISSVGLERLVYTEGVGSSSLSSPTRQQESLLHGAGFFDSSLFHFDSQRSFEAIFWRNE